MIIDKKMIRLICELEYRIGSHTYNPNSYDGWSGDEGCSYKYPVNYCANNIEKKSQKLKKTKEQIEVIHPDCIETMKYTFGSNHLYIGDGIVDALNYIEERYGLDFNKLEKKRIEMKKKEMLKMKEDIENGMSIRVTPGIKIVGIDIPAGIYTAKVIKSGFISMGTILAWDDDGVPRGIYDFGITGNKVEFKENTILQPFEDFILEKYSNKK